MMLQPWNAAVETLPQEKQHPLPPAYETQGCFSAVL